MKRCISHVVLLLLATAAPRAQVTTLPYYEGFELANGGYSSTGTSSSWAWGTPQTQFISSAASGTRAWVTNPGGAYNSNESSFLLSPVFDFRALTTDPFLQFQHIFQTEACCDFTWVEISLDGGPFTKLGHAGDPGSVNWYDDANARWRGSSAAAGTWRTARHALDGGAGKLVQFRWAFSSDSGSSYDGVGVDDVQVFDSLRDVGVASIDAPANGVAHGSSELVRVTLTNAGTTTEGPFPVRFIVTGPRSSMSTEVFGSAMGSISNAPFTFATPVDLSLPGTYTIQVTTLLAGDANPANDSKTALVVQQQVISSFPYVEGFENGDGGYVPVGTLSTWEHGVPMSYFIRSAASGSKAWVTNLDGPYGSPESSFLLSPTFDCRSLTKDVMLRFSHIYDTDYNSLAWVEVSLDNGPYVKLGNAGDPASLEWYNYAFKSAWSQSSLPTSVWHTAQHLVPGSAGALLRIRWALQGYAFQHDGVGIDNVNVFEAPFGRGQAPQNQLATLDINGAVETVGLPVSAGYPGPYFCTISASAQTLDFHFTGTPGMPIVLLGGFLQPAAFAFPGGQIDLNPFDVWAAGIWPGGLNPFFVTNAQGVMNLSATIPVVLIGQVIAFQGVVLGGARGFYVTNAVQAVFLP